MKRSLLFSDDCVRTAKEIVDRGGVLLFRLGDHLLVAELPERLPIRELEGAADPTEQKLDDTSTRLTQAWAAVEHPAKRSPGPTDEEEWDAETHKPPGYRGLPEYGVPGDGLAALAPAPDDVEKPLNNEYLIGEVAVPLVLVSGRETGLVLSERDQVFAYSEVLLGLDFLRRAEPRAKLVWDVHPLFVEVDAARGPDPNVSDVFEAKERGWRDAAMAELGLPVGAAGWRRLARKRQKSTGSKWAFALFVTRYPLHHFAYASSEHVTMHITPNGWQPQDFRRIVAHETCHIFGALDEYGACKCGEKGGHLQVPNNNCVQCSGEQVECLMRQNDLRLCKWSRGQIGWDPKLFPRP